MKREFLAVISTLRAAFRYYLRALPSLGISCLAVCAGCTFSYEAPTLARYGGGPPPTPPIYLTLGGLKYKSSISESNAIVLQRAFEKGVKEATATNLVHFSVGSSNLPPECLVLSGTITEMKKSGGEVGLVLALVRERWRIAGSFQVRNTNGSLLTEFTGEYNLRARGSGFGVGVSGGIMTSWDGMASGLGKGVGEQINSWLSQEKPGRQ